MVRINHGLRAKYDQQSPSSGYAVMMEKIGVIEDNIRRSRIFKEREQQLFNVIKILWNTHNTKSGDRKFFENAKLEITYKIPEFSVDPKTKKEDILMEAKILDTEDTHIISKLYPHMSDIEIKKLVKDRRKDKEEKVKFDSDLQIEIGSKLQANGLGTDKTSLNDKKDSEIPDPKIDNRAKHSEESSKQPGKNGDKRAKNPKKVKDEET